MNREKDISLARMILLNVINFGIVGYWSFDGAIMPLFLTSKFELSNTTIMWILGIGTITIGLSLFFGILTDLVQLSWGKRRPLMLIGGLISAPMIALIPHAPSVALLIPVLTLMYFGIQFAAVPYYALVPEVVPNKKLGTANAFFSAFGGIGTLIAYGVLLLVVYKNNKPLAFYLMAAIHMICTMITFFGTQEHLDKSAAGKKFLPSAVSIISDLFKELPHMKELNWFLVMNLFFWLGLGSFVKLFTKFTEYYVNIPGTQGGLVLGLVVGVSIILAVPVGMLGDKLNRKNMLLGGLALLFVGLTVGYFVIGPTSNVSGMDLENPQVVVQLAQHYGIDASGAEFGAFVKEKFDPPTDINNDVQTDDKKSNVMRWCLNGEITPEQCEPAVYKVLGDNDPAAATTASVLKSMRPHIKKETDRVLWIALFVISFTAIGLTACFLLTATILPTLMNEDKMGLYMGLYSSLTGIGQFVSGILAGKIIDLTLAAHATTLGYRWIFIQGVFCILLAIIALKIVPYIPNASDPTVTVLIKTGKKKFSS